MKILCVMLLAMSISAYSQKVDVFAKGRMPANCQQTEAIAASLIESYPHPKDWTFIVACDNASWTFMASQAGHAMDASSIYGVTMPGAKVTFLRGPALVNGRTGQPSPDHIIAHELAHIMLHSEDDVKVDRMAAKWMAARNHFDSVSGE